MKTLVALVFCLVSIHFIIAQDTMSVAARYQGKNIYVHNPSTAADKFCASKVFINGSLALDSLQHKSAFEIDLSTHTLQSNLSIQIVHEKGCKPRILNSMAHPMRTDFKFSEIKITENDCQFVTKGELPLGKIVLERLQYSQWEEIKTEKGKGSKLINIYSLPVQSHSGKNSFRLKYMEKNGRIHFSEIREFVSQKTPLTIDDSDADTLVLSSVVEYELVNEKGNVLIKNVGRLIPIRKYPSGILFVRADNQVFKIRKK